MEKKKKKKQLSFSQRKTWLPGFLNTSGVYMTLNKMLVHIILQPPSQTKKIDITM